MKIQLKWFEANFTYGDGSLAGNRFVWSDVYRLIGEGLAAGARGADQLAEWQKREPEKKRKLIQLLCRVNGEKFEEEKYVKENVSLTIRDIEFLASKILSEAISVVIVEKKDRLSNRANVVSESVYKSINILVEQLESMKEKITELSSEPNESKIQSLDAIHKEILIIEDKMENLIKSIDGE